jgi:hypothetical protein
VTLALTLRCLSLGMLAAFSLADPARAGSFGDPFQAASVCGQADVETSLVTAYGAFASSSHCAALCRKTESACKALDAKILNCYSNWNATSAAFASRNCSERTPASAARDCKAGVAADEKSGKAFIAAARAQDAKDCEGWGATCQMNCPQ